MAMDFRGTTFQTGDRVLLHGIVTDCISGPNYSWIKVKIVKWDFAEGGMPRPTPEFAEIFSDQVLVEPPKQ